MRQFSIIALIVIALGLLTASRNMAWHDNIALWSNSAGNSPDKHRVRLNTSAYYYNAGRYARALDEAQQAIITEPDKVTGYINAMSASLKLGAYEMAYNYGVKIMSIRPIKVTATNLATLSVILGKKGEFQKWTAMSKGLEDVKRLSLNE